MSLGALVAHEKDCITYFGVQIGKNLHATRALLKDLLMNKTRKVYGLLVATKVKFSYRILGSLHNAFVLPHFFALSPFK